jgi:arylsulfatase A-like enzyme
MYTTFASLGGIGAWVDSSFEPTTITQKYDYSDAPNIVFVLIDDWGYNDPGYQSTYLSWTTPNIDSLASEGIILKNYFSNQICIPSRGALMTGRYPLRLGLWGNGKIFVH